MERGEEARRESRASVCRMTSTIAFQKETKKASAPYKPSTGSLHDLAAAEDSILFPQTVAAVNTGICLELPKGCIGQIFSRSSLALKHDVTVSTGTIDQSYRGPVYVVLRNNGKEPFHVRAGMRVAQLAVLAPVAVDFMEKESLESTGRGHGAFGSTGV